MESNKKESGDKKPKTVRFNVPEKSGGSKEKCEEAQKRPKTAYRVRTDPRIRTVDDEGKPIQSGPSKRQEVPATKVVKKTTSMAVSTPVAASDGISLVTMSKEGDHGKPIPRGTWTDLSKRQELPVRDPETVNVGEPSSMPAGKKPASIPKAKQSSPKNK